MTMTIQHNGARIPLKVGMVFRQRFIDGVASYDDYGDIVREKVTHVGRKVFVVMNKATGKEQAAHYTALYSMFASYEYMEDET